jgi:hypothetical protein
VNMPLDATLAEIDRIERQARAALEAHPDHQPRRRRRRAAEADAEDGAHIIDPGVRMEDLLFYMPDAKVLHRPTGTLWVASAVNARLPWPKAGNKKIKPSDYLARNQAIEQLVWDPHRPQIIEDELMLVSGYVKHDGARLFNLYRPPERPCGDPAKADRWLEHLRLIYPHDAAHVERYFACKVQRPGVKINHGLVLGGPPGIGKDSTLVPVRAAIGAWNCQDAAPHHLLGRFNGYMKAVLLILSEARDLGDMDRFALYEHMKTILAAPPDVIRVDEKHLREHYVVNVCGVVITTNHKLDGLYLPADDRRHYVAWSDKTKDDFTPAYWNQLYAWYAAGGVGHVVAYLQTLDLSRFDPKAPPPKTAAFWAMVQANEAPESGELRDLLEHLGDPAAVTLGQLVEAAQ